jgi:hypothetical protein
VRPTYLVAGAFLVLIGCGVVFYQLSESCENSPLGGAMHPFPWCSDVLDHINLTFVGILSLFAGIIVLALGGSLHWVLEPRRTGEVSPT